MKRETQMRGDGEEDDQNENTTKERIQRRGDDEGDDKKRGETMGEATVSEGGTMKDTIKMRGGDGDQNERRW